MKRKTQVQESISNFTDYEIKDNASKEIKGGIIIQDLTVG